MTRVHMQIYYRQNRPPLIIFRHIGPDTLKLITVRKQEGDHAVPPDHRIEVAGRAMNKFG